MRRAIAIRGHRDLGAPEAGEVVDDELVPFPEDEGPGRHLLELDAEVRESVVDVGIEAPVVVEAADLLDQVPSDLRPERRELEQTIAPRLEPRRDLRAERARALDEPLHVLGGRRRSAGAGLLEMLERQLPNEPCELVEARSARQARLEGVEPFVVPAEEDLLRAAGQIRNVDLDRVLLPDTVETTDPLLEELDAQRQVEQDEVMRELEVASLAADLGAHEHLRTVLVVLGEPRRVPVALQEREVFVGTPRPAGRDARA